MKKLTTVLIIILILSLTTIHSFAAASINLSKPQAEPGSSITISGTAQPQSSFIVKITDEKGEILFFDAVEADVSGSFSIVFMVPADITANKLTISAGSGSDVAMAYLDIFYPAVPTISLLPSPTAPPIVGITPAPGISPVFLWLVIGGAFLLIILLVIIILVIKRKHQ